MTASAPDPAPVPAAEGWYAVVAWPLLGEEAARQEVGRYPVLAWLVGTEDGRGDALVYDPEPGAPRLVSVSRLMASADGRLLRFEHERWAPRPTT